MNNEESEKKYIVAEYMNRNVTTIPKESTLKEAVKKMIDGKTNGLVIIDNDRKVVGILSSGDIARCIVPDYLEGKDQHLAAFESADVFADRVKEMADTPITVCMTRKVHVIKANETLIEATVILSEYGIRQLPVVDDNGILIGYMNRTDIKQAIAEVLGVDK